MTTTDHLVDWSDGLAERRSSRRLTVGPDNPPAVDARIGDTVTLTGPADSTLHVWRAWGDRDQYTDDAETPWTGTVVFAADRARPYQWRVTPADGSPARTGMIAWTA